jgi:PAS domain S-box-containing protein
MAYTGQTAEEMLGGGWIKAVHPEDLAAIATKWQDAVAQSVPFQSEHRVRRHDGKWRWMRVEAAPVCNVKGDILSWFGANVDITERKQAEERERMLMREVNHRSKNMLTLVQALARQTAAADPDEFRDRFSERVQALAAGQDLLVKSDWKGVHLHDLVKSQLAHFEDAIGTRIKIDGPPVLLSAPAAQCLGMALHELGTNAGKYGALSKMEGRAVIAWKLEHAVDGTGTFDISWREQDGPAVAPPARSGFGSLVIGELAERSLDAELDLQFAKTGLTWRLRCPAGNVLEGSGAPPPAAAPVASPAGHSAPPRKRVLVVEDEALVARDIAGMLTEAGFDVLGPARSVSRALSLLHDTKCDGAVLDINLGRETSEPIAQMLLANGTRFITISGYSREQHPSIFNGVPALVKPVRAKVLVEEINKCLANASTS